MLKKSFFTIIAVLLIAFLSHADIPKLINYQGMLTDAEGNPINGTRTIQFSFYLTETGGEAFWSETQEVHISDGLFSVLLGSVTSFEEATAEVEDEVYLEVKVGDDPAMTPRKRIVSVGFAFHCDDSDHLEGYSASSFVRKINEVRPSNGNIDLEAGSNVTITPDAGNNRITISATGGGGSGDNLGNHIATQNIRLNGHWLSNDGGNEGVLINNSGRLSVPFGLDSHGDIITSEDMQAGNMTVVSTLQVNRAINVGSPSSTADAGCISVANDILCDDHVLSENITAYGGWIKTGSPSTSYGNGDIVATDEIIADNVVRTGNPSVSYGAGDIVATDEIVADNVVRTGSPSMSYDSGDIASTEDVIADQDVKAGRRLIVNDHAGINTTGYSTTYALYVSGSAYSTGSWVSSDLRFKKDIQNIQSPMTRLSKLNGVSYNWKTDEYQEREFPEGRHFGLIAQEVEKVLPEIVKTDETGEKAIAYGELIPLLLEAIKQQQKQIEELQRKVNQ